jgi:hypothetical protein
MSQRAAAGQKGRTCSLAETSSSRTSGGRPRSQRLRSTMAMASAPPPGTPGLPAAAPALGGARRPTLRLHAAPAGTAARQASRCARAAAWKRAWPW